LEWLTARGLPLKAGSASAATEAKKQSMSRWMMLRSTLTSAAALTSMDHDVMCCWASDHEALQ